MLIFCWFRWLQWLAVGSNEYQRWYKRKSTILPWEGEGLNWINKLIWLTPSHTGTPVLVQWRARVELPFGDEQSVFISNPVLNSLDPSWNHTFGLCSTWATFAAPAVCWAPALETRLFQVMVPLPSLTVCVPSCSFQKHAHAGKCLSSLGTGVEL